MSAAEKLAADLWAELNPGYGPLDDAHPDNAYYGSIAERLVAAGWKK